MSILSVLVIIGYIFILFGGFFLIGGMKGLLQNKRIYIKLHCLYIIDLYGLNLIFFGIGINSCEANLFFKTLFMIIINSLGTLLTGHIIMRKAFFANVSFECKTREDIENEMIESQKKKMLEEERLEAIRIEEARKEEKRKEKERKKKEKEEKIRLRKEKEEAEEKERKELQDKIREQKRKLRDKIERARKNAMITRKQEEIDKTEKMIQEILTKYNLTEEMLKDDEE